MQGEERWGMDYGGKEMLFLTWNMLVVCNVLLILALSIWAHVKNSVYKPTSNEEKKWKTLKYENSKLVHLAKPEQLEPEWEGLLEEI